ncbi:hypothetical protein EDB89DRAFT_1903295 [Lactarius sanguifluus]|nr:hypothetical protein EDB89DRAFT_1903295 [Lactarius sanguifluus]
MDGPLVGMWEGNALKMVFLVVYAWGAPGVGKPDPPNCTFADLRSSKSTGPSPSVLSEGIPPPRESVLEVARWLTKLGPTCMRHKPSQGKPIINVSTHPNHVSLNIDLFREQTNTRKWKEKEELAISRLT